MSRRPPRVQPSRTVCQQGRGRRRAGRPCRHHPATAQERLLKAIVQDRFGPPEVLQLRDIDQPQSQDREVLVQVRAASVNPTDWYAMTGTPLAGPPAAGAARAQAAAGVDLAGVVAAVGAGVTRFQAGQEVFGGGSGTLAEYAAVPEDALVLKPANLSFEQAAAVPVAALTEERT